MTHASSFKPQGRHARAFRGELVVLERLASRGNPVNFEL